VAESQLAERRQNRPRLSLGGVPVFVFHGLTGSSKVDVSRRERKYWIEARQFQNYLKEICRYGYRVKTLAEFWGGTNPSGPMERMVVLTFDDGLASSYQIAYPFLREASVRAEFFVNTATLGAPGFLNWTQIIEMQRAGMSFQSHSRDHVYLTRLPTLALKIQLSDSKRTLEDRLGRPVEFLSAPYGDLNARVVELAQQVGYRAVCGTRSWPARPGTCNVNRVAIHSHNTSSEFRQLLTGNPVRYLGRTARAVAIEIPKRVLVRLSPSPPPLGYAPSEPIR
jgi:peptidoglycan/xylan/chitin deacetylase (PgdA/CDA1 family)